MKLKGKKNSKNEFRILVKLSKKRISLSPIAKMN